MGIDPKQPWMAQLTSCCVPIEAFSGEFLLSLVLLLLLHLSVSFLWLRSSRDDHAPPRYGGKAQTINRIRESSHCAVFVRFLLFDSSSDSSGSSAFLKSDMQTMASVF